MPVVGDDGVDHTVRACVDGPVFRGDRVLWDAVITPSECRSLRFGRAREHDARGPRPASPVMVAAGCGGTGRELAPYLDLADLGAFVTRSIT